LRSKQQDDQIRRVFGHKHGGLLLQTAVDILPLFLLCALPEIKRPMLIRPLPRNARDTIKPSLEEPWDDEKEGMGMLYCCGRKLSL
jgi:hypothetical protein